MESDTRNQMPAMVHVHTDSGRLPSRDIARKPANSSYQPLVSEPTSRFWQSTLGNGGEAVFVTSKDPDEPRDASRLLLRHDADARSRNQGSSVEGQTRESSVLKLLVQCVVHMLSVFVTVLLLVMNARQAYWNDADGTSAQAMTLQAFQFPVKAHEILMTASITAVILHRVRYDLLVRQDLPLGFLTSPFRTGDITYLFSQDFRQAAFSRRSSRQMAMVSLVFGGIVATLLVGPSSGVLMIPKLAWWNIKHPFGIATDMIYYNTTRGRHWPVTLDSYECGSWGCPNGGILDLTVWGQNMMREHVPPQLTYFGGSSFHRFVTSNSTVYADGWTATTSLMMRDAEAISSFWNYVVERERGPEKLKNPRLSPQLVSGESFLKVLVQVECSAQKVGSVTEFPRDSLRGTLPDMYHNVSWPLSEASLSWTPDPIDTLTFNISSTDGFSNAPTLAGVFRVVRTEDQQPMIAPCSVLAHWIPTKIWINPKNDINSHDALQNPLQAFDTDRSQWQQISLSDEWLEMMGTDVVNTLLESLTQDTNSTMRSGFEGLSWRLSTLLGLLLTDNIARYANEPSIIIYHDGPDGQYAYSDAGILSYGPSNPPDGYESWSQYLEKARMMQIAVTVERYGYGWSFRGVLIKIAAAVLLIHALLAIGHLIVLFHRRWVSTACSSIGGIVALALHSNIVKPADSHGTPSKIYEKQLWSTSVKAFKDSDESLQLGLGRSSGVDHGEVRLVDLTEVTNRM